MRLFSTVAFALGACGDNVPADLADRLRTLPGVHDVTEEATQAAGYRYFVLHFTQPVDHADPRGPTFLQEVSLLHRDTTSPLVVWTSGYWDYYHDRVVEPTGLVDGNQISIEHRYFGESRPADPDWTKLTIEQAADDEHAIVHAFHQLYDGAFVTSGGSKGGMTAVFYRRFYPDDVDGTVPYVAPISFAAPDLRYTPFLDTLGPDTCRQAVRDVATEMLAHRRDALLVHAQVQANANNVQYTRVLIGPALESSVFSLEWSFWQYFGITYCNTVPAVSASDDELFKFLDDISPVTDNSDERVGEFDAYYFQAYFQLGYPDGGAAYLEPYLIYSDADYLGSLPTAQPEYDGGAAMMDIDRFVREQGDRFLFIYGQWDPWTAGAFELGDATDSVKLVQAQGNHGSRITRLAQPDRDRAFAKLQAWTGVAPAMTTVRSLAEFHPPHVPSALLRMRRRSP